MRTRPDLWWRQALTWGTPSSPRVCSVLEIQKGTGASAGQPPRVGKGGERISEIKARAPSPAFSSLMVVNTVSGWAIFLLAPLCPFLSRSPQMELQDLECECTTPSEGLLRVRLPVSSDPSLLCASHQGPAVTMPPQHISSPSAPRGALRVPALMALSNL